MKKQKYTHIKKEERDEISILLKREYGVREIAAALNRNPGSVSREIDRNRRKIKTKRGIREGCYDPKVAHHKSYVRRKYAKYQGKHIEENKELRKHIVGKLKDFWSPDEISGKMREEKLPFYSSKTAIYEWLYSIWGQRWCRYLYSKRYKPRRQNKNKTKRTLIPNRKGVELRPEEANERSVCGHYEGDTMVSGKKTGSKAALTVIYDRKSKKIDARKILSLKPALFNKAICDMGRENSIKTATLDNGIENVKHEELGVPTYFCDPYSPWQKGGVEQSIKMIRRFIPKGTDISRYSDGYVNMVVDILNNKPRKSLGYQTPNEVFFQSALLQNNLQIKKPECVALRG